jgi:hypothetical protein
VPTLYTVLPVSVLFSVGRVTWVSVLDRLLRASGDADALLSGEYVGTGVYGRYDGGANVGIATGEGGSGCLVPLSIADPTTSSTKTAATMPRRPPTIAPALDLRLGGRQFGARCPGGPYGPAGPFHPGVGGGGKGAGGRPCGGGGPWNGGPGRGPCPCGGG